MFEKAHVAVIGGGVNCLCPTAFDYSIWALRSRVQHEIVRAQGVFK